MLALDRNARSCRNDIAFRSISDFFHVQVFSWFLSSFTPSLKPPYIPRMPLLQPSPLLYVGSLPSPLPPLSSIPTLPDPTALESIQPNSLFRRWDFISLFNQDCLKPSEIEPWRHESDELADQVVEVLGLVGKGSGRDAYQAVKEYVESQEEREEGDPVKRFWEEMNRLPGEGVSGLAVKGEKGGEKRFTPLKAFEETPVSYRSSAQPRTRIRTYST